MDAFDTLFAHSIAGLAMLKFYSLMKNWEIKKVNVSIIVILYGMYQFLTKNMIVEPLRMILSFAFLGVLLLIFDQKLSWTILFIAFLLTDMLDLLATLVSVVTLTIPIMLGIKSIFLNAIVSSMASIVVFTGVILLDKYQKIKLSIYSSLLETALIQKMVLTMGLMIIISHRLVDLSLSFDINYGLMLSLVFWIVSCLFLLTIIFLSILFVKYLNSERKRQRQCEREKFLLVDENQSLVSKWHGMKEVVVSNHLFFLQFEVELAQRIAEKEILEKMSQIKAFNAQVGDDLSLFDLEKEMRSWDIPDEWLRLRLRLAYFIHEAKHEGIKVSVDHQFKSWDQLDFSEAALIKLVANLISNAIKELRKATIETKLVNVKFLNHHDGYFVLEVHDNADAFPIGILQKLGKRQNSTNGTGDGYHEIFKLLGAAKASFELVEHLHTKMIRVTCDGYHDRTICSSYRVDELLLALEHSMLVVI